MLWGTILAQRVLFPIHILPARYARMTVPSINLQPFLANTFEGKRAVANEIANACTDIGFFVVTGHGVSPQLIDETYNITRAFFDLSDAEKRATPLNEYGAGYSPLQGEALSATMGTTAPADLKESLNIGKDKSHNLIPAQPADGQRIWYEYFDAMESLAGNLLRAFALALDLEENFFADKIDRDNSFLRLINYPDQPTPPIEGQLRAGAHSDYGTLTILRAENAPGGLQVLTRSGEWLAVNIVPDSFVINIGDLMMRWTNDQWVSTIHRVANPQRDKALGSRRQSMVFFHNPNNDALIAPLPGSVDENHPAKYEPITAGEHLAMKVKKAYGT